MFVCRKTSIIFITKSCIFENINTYKSSVAMSRKTIVPLPNEDRCTVRSVVFADVDGLQRGSRCAPSWHIPARRLLSLCQLDREFTSQ